MLRDTPIYINNRNRLTSTSKLVEWLRQRGYERITILDNAASYPPLLEYYKTVPVDIRRMRNSGPWAFWDMAMWRQQSTKYIVTDSDCVPSEDCPDDLIERLSVVLDENPGAGKVGPSLRMNGDEPQSELCHWQRRHSPEAFYAGIDTTFAIYNAGSPFVQPTWKNLRLDFPYTVDHWPWFSDSKSEEEVYYRAHAENGWSHLPVCKPKKAKHLGAYGEDGCTIDWWSTRK